MRYSLVFCAAFALVLAAGCELNDLEERGVQQAIPEEATLDSPVLLTPDEVDEDSQLRGETSEESNSKENQGLQ